MTLPMDDQDDVLPPWAMSGGEPELGDELQPEEESGVLNTEKSRRFHAFLTAKFDESADKKLWFTVEPDSAVW